MLIGEQYDDVRMFLMAADGPMWPEHIRQVLPARAGFALSAMIATGDLWQTSDGRVYLPERRLERTSPVPREVRHDRP